MREEVQAAMGVRSSQLLGLREDFHFGSQGSLYRCASGGVARPDFGFQRLTLLALILTLDRRRKGRSKKTT